MLKDSYIEDATETGLGQSFHHLGTLMSQVCDRPKGVNTGQVITDSLDLLAESNEHAHGSLTMPNVVYFFPSDPTDVPESGRKVIGAHLIEGEVPKLQRNGTEVLS